jgi:hypothetical protein
MSSIKGRIFLMRFQVLTAASIRWLSSRLLMMEAASTSEISVNIYQIKWCNNPEDSHLQDIS